MDQTLEPYVKKMLDGGIKTAEDIAKFIEVQTPELGREIITWGAISEAIAPLIGLLGIISSLFVHFKCSKHKWYAEPDSYADTPGIIFNIIFMFVSSCIFFSQIMGVIYPLVAPRLYILEKVSSFVK
jgi:hypothetical protein